MNDRKQLEDYLKEKYNLVAIPGPVRTKLDKAFRIGIEPDILLKLFKRMTNEINNIWLGKIAAGSNFDNISQKLNFDLSVVLNKYDKFAKNLPDIEAMQDEKAAAKEAEEKQMRHSATETKKISKKDEHEERLDINSIVDEIFFSDFIQEVD